jgi:hypothetical protein
MGPKKYQVEQKENSLVSLKTLHLITENISWLAVFKKNPTKFKKHKIFFC